MSSTGKEGGSDGLRPHQGANLPERSRDRPLPRQELDRIIRRAAELQFHASDDLGQELSEKEVIRIGEEVGLDPSYVRRAMEEARADALAPDLPPDPSWLRRVIGPGRVQLRRVIPGSPDELEARLAQWLKEQESLHPVRRRSGTSLWEPAEGILPQIQRGLKWKGHRYDLARAKQVEVVVLSLEDGFSLVTLNLDLRNLRMEQGGGYLFVSGIFGGGGGVVLGLAALSLPPLGAAGLGLAGLAAGGLGGTMAGRHSYQEEAEKVRLAAEGLLDRLEQGGLIPGARGGRRHLPGGGRG